MAKKTPLMSRWLAALLIGVLLLASPGPGAWAGAAEIVKVEMGGTPLGAGAQAGTVRPAFDKAILQLPAPVHIQELTTPEAPLNLEEGSLPLVFADQAESRETPPIRESADVAAEGAVLGQNASNITAETRSRMAPAGLKIRTRIRTILSVFSRKDAEELPSVVEGPSSAKDGKLDKTVLASAVRPASGSLTEKEQPPAPAGNKTARPIHSVNNRFAWLHRWVARLFAKDQTVLRSFFLFTAVLVLIQFGAELFSPVYGQWSKHYLGAEKFGAQQSIGSLISVFSGFVGGMAADKLGLKTAYVVLTALGAASVGAIIFFTGHATSAVLLISLYGARVFFVGAARTSEPLILAAICKGKQKLIQKYSSISQFILEWVGIIVPGCILSLQQFVGGASHAMALAALTALAAMLFFAGFTRVSEYRAKTQTNIPPKPVDRDPALFKIVRVAYPAVGVINILLYTILALSFGNFVHPGSNDLALNVQGKIVAFFSAGGLLAGAWLSGIPQYAWSWLKRLFDKKSAPAQAASDPAKEKNRELKSLSFWVRMGALGLMGFGFFLMTNPLWAYGAMIILGITHVMASLKLNAHLQANMPSKGRGTILGVIRTAMFAAAAAGTYGFGKLQTLFEASPMMPFAVMMGAFVVLGVLYLWLAHRIDRLRSASS